ncbi:MAG: SGNH/GDSL hydrolase family protein [Rhodoferax sp.]|nr:SGNH/GDSL hydrolase family protein [Actinomycetota bacterium]
MLLQEDLAMDRLRRHPVITGVVALVLALSTMWAVKLGQLGRSVGTYAEYWSQPRGETGGLLYVALGDSAAQSIGASAPGRGYVGLIAQRLRTSTGQPVEVVNLSSSGARIRDVLATQLPALDALGREPDVITVAVGGNDIGDYDQATFAAEARVLTEALPAGAYVADVPYFMHGRWQRDAAEAAVMLRANAKQHGLHVVALQNALEEQGWQAMGTQFAADWFHPNDRGHRVWADAFWTRIGPDVDPDCPGHRTASPEFQKTGPKSCR